jgi:hypothetical protein
MKRLALVFILILTTGTGFAAKTDTLTMNNGDRVTCEIKNLSMGKLTVKTSDMGTLSVKWLRIDFIESKQILEITFRDHNRIYGTLNKADSVGYATIHFGIYQETYPLEEIVNISQISSSFWQGLDGSMDYGISFASGTENLQSTFSGNVSYKQKLFKHELKLNSVISQSETTFSQKQDATYYGSRYLFKRGFITGQLGLEQNSELGIESRVITGVSFGYEPVDNNANNLTISLGTVYNRELDNEGTVINNMEGVLAVDYNIFLLYKPKISFMITGKVFPSIQPGNRIRTDLNTKLSWEIFSDFTLSGSYYNNYDSNPSSATALKMDWGFTTSIGYTF